jgi:nitrite reductase/ring-hydroxylating ferredoxin subunit
MRLSRNFF